MSATLEAHLDTATAAVADLIAELVRAADSGTPDERYHAIDHLVSAYAQMLAEYAQVLAEISELHALIAAKAF